MSTNLTSLRSPLRASFSDASNTDYDKVIEETREKVNHPSLKDLSLPTFKEIIEAFVFLSKNSSI
ncbi:MAG: hypothetical protein K1060chlam4_01474 [Candidatus Anoxychlamydiales bacterium]|nr:hypothetical protein [Candidatus Anoxychlamydiales bacterium]